MKTNLPEKPTLAGLIKAVREEIEAGKAAAEIALDCEKTATYWKVGRHIDAHLAAYRGRKEGYGEYAVREIARALEIGTRVLYWALDFYRRYPKTPSSRPKLTWSHYRILLSVRDETLRSELENRVLKERLSTRELLELVKNVHPQLDDGKPVKLLNVERGRPHVYRISAFKMGKEEELSVDLGFRMYLDGKAIGEKEYPDGTIIQADFQGGVVVVRELPPENASLLFTYVGYVREVIDGDTLWVNLKLGFGALRSEKIRLRGINAYGVNTAEGQRAKEFLEYRLAMCDKIIVKTHWRDKYDRYLGDIFYDPATQDMAQVAENGAFLNQEMLDSRIVTEYKGKRL